MIVYVLFVNKKSAKKRKVCLFKKKNKNEKNQKKTFLVDFLCGFFGGFLGFFGWVFWVGFHCQPCLEAATRRTPPGSWLLECDRPGEETRRLKGTVSRDRIHHFLCVASVADP
jgi:hypothetical protein